MSESTPAASKAALRYFRSAVSQRTDDLLSGRMTPIFGFLVALPASLPFSPQAAMPPRAKRPQAVVARILFSIVARSFPLGVLRLRGRFVVSDNVCVNALPRK